MSIQWQVRTLLVLIALSFLIIGANVMARGEGWPTSYQHFNDIRSLAKGTPKGKHVRFVLNDGRQVFGTMLKYEAYTDYIWYQPQGTRTWWAQDAFDVHELAMLQVVEPV